MSSTWPAALAALAISLAGFAGFGPAHAAIGPNRPITWLAAGDSYSSGQGLPIVTGGCAQPGRAGEQVWAQYAADQLTGTLPLAGPPKLVACTGAKTSEFFAAQGGNPAEWTASMGRYDLVSFTFGGDDVDFADVVAQCVGLTQVEQSARASVLWPAATSWCWGIRKWWNCRSSGPGGCGRRAATASARRTRTSCAGWPAISTRPSARRSRR